MAEKSSFLDLLIQNAPVGVQVLDTDGMTVRVNPVYMRMYGVGRAEDVVGILNVFQRDSVKEHGLLPYVERAFHGETVVTPSIQFHSTYGAVCDIRMTLYPVLDNAGLLGNVVILHEDVTHQREAERALYQRYRQIATLQTSFQRIANQLDKTAVLQNVLNAIEELLPCDGSAVWSVNAATGHWRCIAARGVSDEYQWAVEAGYRNNPDPVTSPDAILLDRRVLQVEDAAGDPRLGLVRAALEREGVRKLLAVPLKIGSAVDGTLTFYYHTPGGFDPIDVETAVLLADQAAIALHNADLYSEAQTMRDELERRVQQRTEELRAMHEETTANEKLAAVGFLAKEVAHTMRNPLNVIATSMYYLKSRFPDPDEKVLRHFDTVLRYVDQSANTINQLMNVAGSGKPELAVVNMNALAQRALSERHAEKIQWRTEWAADLPPVMGDWTQLSHAVKALLSNAADSSDLTDGGEVFVRTSVDKDQVVLAVGDRRESLTEEERQAIFEPLFTSATRWTGLGLTVAKQIAKRHNGEVGVNEEGGVTWFLLCLPVAS